MFQGLNKLSDNPLTHLFLKPILPKITNAFPVFQGLNKLLDNPLTHLFLKPILPQITNAFHDVSEKVRVSMLDLLIKVKTLRAIKVHYFGFTYFIS